MADVSKNFIDQFHTLPGNTVGEKRRSLSLLLRQSHSSLTENGEALALIAENLRPTSHLEQIFRIDVLIHFRRAKELLQDCLNGDEIALKRVAKQEWFFQNVFQDIETEDFVNNILPTLPYVFKFHVLKKLSVEQQADEIFDALVRKYGIFLSAAFLPKCSVEKITATLRNHLIKLTHPQLQLLCMKDPNLIWVYFEERSKHVGNTYFMNDDPFLVYVAQKSPKMFARLYNKYKFVTSLGYRTSKTLIESLKDEIMTHLQSYVEILNNRALVKLLGPALTQFFFHIIPFRRRECYWTIFLKYYPKSQKFDLFKTAYNLKFYQKFGDNIDAVTEDMLKLIKKPTEREVLAKLKLQKTGDTRYLQYVTPKYCMDKFKEKLNQISATERARYVEVTTVCCLLNKDLDTLLELSELVAIQFKNDERDTRISFLHPFDDEPFRGILDEFSEEHWKLMMEIIATCHAKKDWGYYDGRLRFNYLKYLIKHDKPLRDIIPKYSDWTDLFEYNHQTEDAAICDKILCALLETEPLKSEDSDDYTYYVNLLRCCREFHKANPKYRTNVVENPKIMQTVEAILTRKISFICKDEIEYIICRKEPSELLNKFKILYFKEFKTFGQTSGCRWFLKNDPETFQKYLKDFLENFHDVYDFNHRQIWWFIKKYHHLGLDKEVVEYCKSKLEADGVLNKKLVEALAILCPGNSYVELIQSLEKIDATEDEEKMKDSNTTQCDLITLLHFVNSPTTTLPIALQFCKNGFLKSALCPLYNSVYRLPENRMKRFIEELNEDETFKVHAVHLSSAVLDSATVFNYLENTLPPLICLSKYLAKNPSNAVWELIERKLPTASIKDLRAFKWVMRTTLPLVYKTKYIEAIWTFLNNYENKEMKKIVFENMDLNIVQSLPPSFAYRLIEDSIFTTEESNDLISSLLVHMKDDDKFEFVKRTLEKLKENCWTCKASQGHAGRQLHDLIKSVSKIYIEAETADEDFRQKFSETFTSLFSSSEAFEEFVIVSFMTLKGRNVEDCGEIFVEFNNNLVATYGRAIVHPLANALNEYVVPHVFKTEDEKMTLCHAVFKSRKSLDDCLLIISLLPESEPEDIEQYKLYDEILTDLERTTDSFIQLQFKLYLKRQEQGPKKRRKRQKTELDPRIVICPCKV